MRISVLKSVFLCLMILVFSPSAHALDWGKTLRPYVEKYLGADTAKNWFGEKAAEVQLPPIPEVSEKASSVETYKNSEGQKDRDSKNELSKEKEKQYNYAFINNLYESVINEEPNRDDLAKWMNAMGQGATREGVYRGLVLGKTYKGMENYTDNANERVAKFAESFSERFLNRSVKAEELQQTNFFTVKRLTTERTLETLDALLQKEDHFERWYAVFSGELAKKYPDAWENKIRKDTSEKKHLQWAKQVPHQHVKSEVIIKLHKLMNALMGGS